MTWRPWQLRSGAMQIAGDTLSPGVASVRATQSRVVGRVLEAWRPGLPQRDGAGGGPLAGGGRWAHA